MHFANAAAMHVALSLSATSLGAARTVSVPANWNGFGYLFNLTVGTPPQEMTVMSDWTWMSLFFRSGRCMNQWNVAECIGNRNQVFFNEKESKTFKNRSLSQISWDITAFAPNFTVDYAADTVCVGNICSENTMQMSDFPYPGHDLPEVPFAGIYGMAPVTPEANETFYTANYQTWKDGKYGSRVGWHNCETLSSRDTCLGGESKFVLGGTDTSLYDQSQMQEYKAETPDWLSDAFYPHHPETSNYWATTTTGFWIIGKDTSANFASQSTPQGTPEHPTLGVLDEGSEGLAAPVSLNAYKWLVKRVQGTLADANTVKAIIAQGSSGFNGDSQDWYTVSCDNVSQYPELIYELDGRNNYSIQAQDYVVELKSVPAKTCYLNAGVWKFGRTDSGNAKVLVLGAAFFKRLYVMLDFRTLTFGLAPLAAQ